MVVFHLHFAFLFINCFIVGIVGHVVKTYLKFFTNSCIFVYVQAATTLVDENGEATERPLKDPGLILKYSTHKNMASMAADKGDINTAMEHYLQVLFHRSSLILK